MSSSLLSDMCFALFTFLILFNQYIYIVQGMLYLIYPYFTLIYLGGNCFYLRNNDLCYDLSEMDTNEEECTGSYYSDDNLKELDGYVYAEKCRDVNGM